MPMGGPSASPPTGDGGVAGGPTGTPIGAPDGIPAGGAARARGAACTGNDAGGPAKAIAGTASAKMPVPRMNGFSVEDNFMTVADPFSRELNPTISINNRANAGTATKRPRIFIVFKCLCRLPQLPPGHPGRQIGKNFSYLGKRFAPGNVARRTSPAAPGAPYFFSSLRLTNPICCSTVSFAIPVGKA